MRRTVTRLAVAVLLATAFLGGCGHKGKARLPAKLTSIEHRTVRPEEVWSRGIGNGSGKQFSGLRIIKGPDALFAAAEDGRVYALNPATGKVIWRVRTKARVISGPSIDGDMVLVGTLDGEVIALKRGDGSPIWRAQAPSEALAAPAGNGHFVVAKAVDGRMYGLDADSGERKWIFDRNEPNLTLRGMSAPLIIGNRVYSGLDSGKLTAVNLIDGSLVWEQTISVPTGRSELDRLTDIDADLLLSDEGLYVVTYGGDLSLIDLDTGDSRWRRSVKSSTGMSLGASKLFVTDDDGVVWAFDSASGAVVWKNEQIKFRHLSPPVYFKNYVVVGDYKGYLHWLSADDGHLVGRNRLSSKPIIAPPLASDDLLYVMDIAGELEAFQATPAK